MTEFKIGTKTQKQNVKIDTRDVTENFLWLFQRHAEQRHIELLD